MDVIEGIQETIETSGELTVQGSLRGQAEFQVKLETRSDPKAPPRPRDPKAPDPKAPDPKAPDPLGSHPHDQPD